MVTRSDRLDHVHSDIRGPLYQEALRMESEGINVLKLNTGNPGRFGFKLPNSVRQALALHIDEAVPYCDVRGMAAARNVICTYHIGRGLQGIMPNDVFICNGVSEAASMLLNALIGTGDEILLPSPCYSLWSNNAYLCGGKPVFYRCDPANEWNPDIEDIESKITDRTKAILVINPNNPTGAIMTRDELQAIATVIKDTNIIVLSDEIYNSLTYGPDRHVCFAELDGMKERTIVINGFSKAFAMTGWRLGYILADRRLVKQMLKIHQFAIMCAPTLSQYAAISAVRDGDADVERMRMAYNQRRNYLMKAFRDMGLKCFEPFGAFYVFPSIKEFGMTSDEFATKLLQEEKVAVVPGTAFGQCGEGFLRISYAYSIDDLKIALGRMQNFIDRHRK